jgi:hypothetical protein
MQLPLQLDLTQKVEKPRLVPALILPPDLVDASASAQVVGFKIPVVITQNLCNLLRPEDGPLEYHKRLLAVLDIAHTAFTLGGKKPPEFWFDLTVHFNKGDIRLQQNGVYAEFFGVKALVIGFPLEVK